VNGGWQPSPVPKRDAQRMWYVVLTVAGSAQPLETVRAALERLAHDHPFLLAGRYAADRAEVRYWEEARDIHDAAALVLRLWGEHRRTAQLPAWEVVGIEVVDRDTYQRRFASDQGPLTSMVSVGVHPF
jgi:hypothetical protein